MRRHYPDRLDFFCQPRCESFGLRRPFFASTRKRTDPKWMAPDGAELALDVRDPEGPIKES
jgi:hypothetical protein